jgi:hypothetical protein
VARIVYFLKFDVNDVVRKMPAPCVLSHSRHASFMPCDDRFHIAIILYFVLKKVKLPS